MGLFGCLSLRMAKILFLVCNIIFMLVGAKLIAVGIFEMLIPNGKRVLEVASHGYDDPLLKLAIIAMILTGSLIIVVAQLGFMAYYTKNTSMLFVFAVLVAPLLLFQLIAAGILAAAYLNKIEDHLQTKMTESLAQYKDVSSHTVAIDNMQIKLKCCGVSGFSDWKDQNSITNTTVSPILQWQNDFPPSCCKLKEEDPNKITENNFAADCKNGEADSFYTDGCHGPLSYGLKHIAAVITGVAFGLSLGPALVLVMALSLRDALQREKRLQKAQRPV